jgi:uncharacterized membrane protein
MSAGARPPPPQALTRRDDTAQTSTPAAVRITAGYTTFVVEKENEPIACLIEVTAA